MKGLHLKKIKNIYLIGISSLSILAITYSVLAISQTYIDIDSGIGTMAPARPTAAAKPTKLSEDKEASNHQAARNTKTVRSVQEALRREGYSVIVDGKIGPNTVKAIREFQAERGLDQSGFLNPETLNALENNSGATDGRLPASVPVDINHMPEGIDPDFNRTPANESYRSW